MLLELRCGWGSSQVGKHQREKKNPYWVLPLSDGKDFNWKMTLASHLRQREELIQSISCFPKDGYWDPGWVWGTLLLGEVKAFWKVSASSCWLCGPKFGQEGAGGKGMEGSTQNQLVTYARWAVVVRIGEWTWSQNSVSKFTLSPWLGNPG